MKKDIQRIVKSALPTWITMMIAAVTVVISLKVMAIHHQVSNSYSYNGHTVYSVSIYNDNDYQVHCSLTATNGASYNGYVEAKSWSGRMRINDINASFKWRCIPSET